MCFFPWSVPWAAANNHANCTYCLKIDHLTAVMSHPEIPCTDSEAMLILHTWLGDFNSGSELNLTQAQVSSCKYPGPANTIKTQKPVQITL